MKKRTVIALSLLLLLTGCGKKTNDGKENISPSQVEYHSNLDVSVVNSVNGMQIPVLTADYSKVTLFNPDDMSERLWSPSGQSDFYYVDIYDKDMFNEDGFKFVDYGSVYEFEDCQFGEPTGVSNGKRCFYSDGINFLYEAYNDANVKNAKDITDVNSFVSEIEKFGKYTDQAKANGEMRKYETDNEIVLWCPVKFVIRTTTHTSGKSLPGVFYLRQTPERQYVYIATIQSTLEPTDDDYGYLLSKISYDDISSDVLSQGSTHDVELQIRGSYPMKFKCPASITIPNGSYEGIVGFVNYNSGIYFMGTVNYLYGDLGNLSTDEFLDQYVGLFFYREADSKEVIRNDTIEVTKFKQTAQDFTNGATSDCGYHYGYVIRSNRYVYRFFVDTLYGIDEAALDAMFESVALDCDSYYEDTTLSYKEDFDYYLSYVMRQGLSEIDAKRQIYQELGMGDPYAHRPPATSNTSWDNPWYTTDELLNAHNGLSKEEEEALGIFIPYDENVDGPPAWDAAWEAEQATLEEQQNAEEEEIDDSYYEN